MSLKGSFPAVGRSGIVKGIMHITMNDTHIVSISQLTELMKVTNQVEFKSQSKDEKYSWINEVVGRFNYFSRTTQKKNRGIITYIQTMTGLSRPQVKKLIKRKKKTGRIERIKGTRNSFSTIYGPDAIARLIETDNAHGRISGEATRAIMEREYSTYGDNRYELIRHISVSRLYDLRKTNQYESQILFVGKTTPTSADIGIRKKPHPEGKPGYIRVDSVHQGDLDKKKGVYHINLVDEVTQWEIVGCTEGISEYFLQPLLEELMEFFPFTIINFHSDNGSEYINRVVAELLAKMTVEQTKSRSRRTNDNALVEGKNGSRIRKHMGYAHIHKTCARSVNEFYKIHLNNYFNFHRPCGFATDMIDAKGKIKKIYDTYLTPFQKLKSIQNVEQYLKPGITIASLETIAATESDNTAASKMQIAKQKLFASFRKC